LREHPDDIPPLCTYLLSKIAPGQSIELPEPELAKLKDYDWPGNVRELRNILERALFLQKGSAFAPSLLVERSSPPSAPSQPPSSSTEGAIKTLAQAEREIIQGALTALSSNLTQTAKSLGISLSTLKRKLKEYGLK
jgi:DNA-binding NtrC family response regulator